MTNNRPQRYRVEQFFAIRQILGFSVSPDGKTIAYITNTNGLPNIWTIPIDGGWTSQITISADAIKNLDYVPHSKKIIFQSDTNGDENLQLFMVGDKGGEITSLSSSHKGAQVFLVAFNKKGTKLLFNSNKRLPGHFDTYELDIKSGKETVVRESNEKFVEMAADWSRDGKKIVYEKDYNNSDSDIVIHNRITGESKNITKHEGSMRNAAPSFNKEGNKVFFLSDYRREFQALASCDLKSGYINWEAEENWDIVSYRLSNSGKFLLYLVNENGISKLKKKSFKGRKSKTLKIPAGNIYDFALSADDKKVIYLYDGPRNPNDLFVYNMNTDRSKQITFSMIGGIPKNDFTKPSLVTYKSFDGLEISAWLYAPKWMKKDGSNPAVVWPHGGPEWQEKNLFNKYLQILNNRGYAVIAPNFRGSTGYGKTFQKKIYRDWGGDELKDVIGAYDYIAASGYADKNRIAVVGGSFGGFMTLTCVTKHPELWKCAVDIFGPSNMFTFLDSIPEHWKPGVTALVGDPVNDKEMLFERSPINFVQNIKCPLLVIQGKHDPRVVITESDQMVAKMKEMGKEVVYYVFEDEGHGFMKVSNQIICWNMITDFLDKNLQSI